MKIVALCVIAALAYMVGYVLYYGFRYARSRDPLALGHHQGGISCVMWLTLLLISIIELTAMADGRSTRGALFEVHLGFALLFVCLFVAMRVHFNGLSYPVAHRYVAYSAATAFAGMLSTGGVLLYQA